MKNPCKDCLVMPVCIDPSCKKLNEFIHQEFIKDKDPKIAELIKIWYKKIEIRPNCLPEK